MLVLAFVSACVCMAVFELACELCAPAATKYSALLGLYVSFRNHVSLKSPAKIQKAKRSVCLCVCVHILVPKLGRKVKK